MKIKKTAAVLLTGSLLGVTAYSSTAMPFQVQAKASYKVQVTKNAYVYTSKGKKTKTLYKKNKVVTAYRIRQIKGKYYYDLGKGKYIRTNSAKKYYYRTYTQSKKFVRTIKLYQPKDTKTVKQNAYVKRTVKQNTKTKKKTYSKWGTASWQAYTAPSVKGYTASPKSVAKETVYSWTKNKTVKVKYKKSAKKQTSKPTTPVKQSTPAKSDSSKKGSAPSQTPSKPNTNTKDSSTTDKKDSNTSSDKSESTPSQTPEKKLNPWNETKEKILQQQLLGVINDFRSQAGMKPLTYDNEFEELSNERALSKATYYLHGGDLNHDGIFDFFKKIESIEPSAIYTSESLSCYPIGLYDTDEEQINSVVTAFRKSYQEEKDDYEAMVINHTRTKITNPYGTFGHYTTIMLDKPETGVNMDTPNAEFADFPHTKLALGIGVASNPGAIDGVIGIVELAY